MSGATASAGIPAGCASGGTHYDIWYSFTAQSISHTVTISNLQSNFTNPELQIFSGTCGSLTSLACGTTTVSATGLTIGNSYYIRISNVGSSVSSQGRFDICVTHPPAAPANDDCSGATVLTSATTCSSITANLRYATSAGPAGACGGATATTTYDVWFRFQATATTQTITVNSLGSRLTAASTYIQVLSGACGSLVSLGCQTVATRQTISGLTIGTFYYARVYVLASPTASATADWNFNICVQQPPANDECAGAIMLTPGATCTNTAGSLDLATANGGVPLGCFAAGTYFDVWYRFIATAVSHTITLNSLGGNFTAPRLQIYSGGCGALVSMGCAAGTTLTQGGLTIGNMYFVRVANFNANPSGIGSVANFNICVTAAAAPPANDLCTGAILLTSGTTCSNIAGTLINATATAGLPACGNAASPEVWYRFVAQSAYPLITLSNIGANLATANPRIQLFSGVCGTLTSLACSASPLNTRTAPGGAGLTVGATYYLRITTTGLAAPVAAGTYAFNICVTDQVGAAIDYGKSYVNLTDGTVGGTINPGDVLEIRATLVVNRVGAVTKAIDSVAFYDTLSAGAGLAYNAGTIALRTNEGKLYSPSSATYYTDAYDIADAAWTSTAGAGSDTMIQINMGLNATYAARGKLRSNSRPSFNTNTCIILATYRVTVNAAYGTKINFGGGAFSYRDTATGVFYTINFPDDSLMVYQSPDACLDDVSTTNVLGDEVNGTFGASAGPLGAPQNRGTSPNTDYTYATFAAGAPNDYYYGVANNTSAAGSTNQTLPKGNAARVHTVWDITGDHTGAVNTARGNLPCNLTQPISATNPCGYMLVINSAYKTDKAFRFNVSGACTETYYEITGWFKNICYKCGCDSTGRFTSSAGYIPTAPGDSAGVRPNIAVEINGIDYYTTGDLVYQGLGGTQTGSDTLNNWVRRSFVYKTGPSETNFAIDFRNNAPGGGGNDWALDDISLKTCTPNINVTPTSAVNVCEGGTVDLGAIVTSHYDSYKYAQWEISSDNGASWTPSGPVGGPAAPTWNGSAWEYSIAYPTFVASAGDNGKRYRVAVASTVANAGSSSCNFTDGAEIELTVDTNCVILNTNKLELKGKNVNNEAILDLSTLREEGPVRYEVEKSFDGMTYTTIASINGNNNPALEKNHYSYVDPELLKSVTWYRFKRVDADNKIKLSNVVRLVDTKTGISIQSLINPYRTEVKFEIVSGYDGDVKIELLNQNGQSIRSKLITARKGVNPVVIDNVSTLASGFYILRVSSENTVIHRKLVKGSY